MKKIMIMKKFLKLNLMGMMTLAMFSLAMVSCDDDDDGGDVDLEPVAYVSMYQASPNSPALDIMVDNRRINTFTFDYTDYTGYLRFFTGDRNLSFGPANASNVVVDTTVTFEDQKVYSVFLAGEYPNVEALVFEDDAESPSSGNAMVRFINLSPDVSSTDLVIEGEADPLFEDQSYKEAPEFRELSAEVYDFEVRNPSDDNVLLQVPNINLVSGYFYTILVRGYETPPAGNTNNLSVQILVN